MHTFGDYSKKRENETVSNCHQLKLKVANGGMGVDTKAINISRLSKNNIYFSTLYHLKVVTVYL